VETCFIITEICSNNKFFMDGLSVY